MISLTKEQRSAVVRSLVQRLKRYPNSYRFTRGEIPKFTGTGRGPRISKACLLAWGGYYIQKIAGTVPHTLDDVAESLGYTGDGYRSAEGQFYKDMDERELEWISDASAARAALMAIAQARGL